MIWASKIILYMTPQMAPTTDPTQNLSEAPQNLSEAQQTPQNLSEAIPPKDWSTGCVLQTRHDAN